MKHPPYAKRINHAERELRVYLGHQTAWRHARIDSDAGRHRQFLMQPGEAYHLEVVRDHEVFMVALDDSTLGDVRAAADDLLRAGAVHVAAVSPHGSFRVFIAGTPK
jgi:hypothetical protein